MEKGEAIKAMLADEYELSHYDADLSEIWVKAKNVLNNDSGKAR